MANGFSEGLSSSLAGNLEQVNKNRLELTMKSKAIEMELKKRAAEMAQDEGRNFIRPEDWNPLIQGINPNIKEIPQFSSSVPQQAFLSSQKQLPAIAAKGQWSQDAAKIRDERRNKILSNDEKAIIKAGLSMSGAPKELLSMFDQPDITNLGLLAASRFMPQSNPAVIKEVSDSMVALRNAPEFFDALVDIGNKHGELTLRAVQGALASNSNVIDAITDASIAPDLKQKLRSTVTLFLFATGGKTLTANEQRAVMGLVSAPSNDIRAIQEAKKDFLDILSSRTKGLIQSGKLGWRGLEYVDEFNTLVESAGYPQYGVDKHDAFGSVLRPKEEAPGSTKSEGSPKSLKEMSTEDLWKQFTSGGSN